MSLTLPLRLLLVHDGETEARHILDELRRAGLQVVAAAVVATQTALLDALGRQPWDVMLCADAIPDMPPAVVIDTLHRLALHMPCIIVAQTQDEAAAVTALHIGMADYVAYDQLARLPAAIEGLVRAARQDDDAAVHPKVPLGTVFQAFHDLYFRLNLDGGILDYSASNADLYLAPDQFLGRRMQDVLPPPIGGHFAKAIEQVRRRQMEASLSYTLPIRGVERHFEARLLPLPPAHIVVIVRDMTRYARVSAARDQLAAILEATPDFVGTADAQGRPLYLNRAGRRMVGLAADEALPETITACHPVWASDLIQREAIPATLRDGVWSGESALRHRDGHEIPVSQVVLAHRATDGGLAYLSTIIRDISDRKQAEQALQRHSAAMEGSMDGMALLDPDGKYIYLNEAHVKVYGYDSPRELIGESWTVLYRGAELERFQTQIMPGFWRAGQWHGESVGTRRDGSSFPQEISLNRLADGGLVCVVRDISERKQAEQALQQAESKYRSMFENALEGIFQTTPDGQYLTANPALARIYGYASPAEMTAGITNIADQLYLEPGRRDEFVRLMNEQDRVEGFESLIRRKDGSVIWIAENSRAIRDEAGRLIGYEGTVMDITAHKEAEAERLKAEAALRASEARLRDIVEHSSNMFYTRTPDHILTYVSPQVRQFLDYEPEQALVRWTEFTTDHPINREGLAIADHAIATGQAQPVYNLELIGKNGRTIFVEVNEAPVVRSGKTVAVVGALVDITQRHAIEEQLKHQAFHDALTSLPNRALFMDRLQHALTRLKRHAGCLAVLFLDLDRFKIINDSLGHEVGDQLLQAVTARLISCLRPDDTVARLGGDEFTILMEDIDDVADAIGVAERIAGELQRPFTLKGQEVFMTTSVGIALSQSGDDSPDDLLRDADVAMYRAKLKGRAEYEVFDPDMNARALERLTLETDLWQAVGRDELRVHYQPKVNLRTGQIIGLEALVRWEHPQHGLVSPGEFIPLAEETGIILSIGRWVLREACFQACRWMERELTPEPLQMSVNLSVRQLQQPTLAQEVAEVLAESGLPPHLLKLEITESVVMSDAEHTIATLRDLKALGVHLAIDDFGTGYSSLSYLRRFPMNTLKIDRCFINNLGTDHEDTEIVRAIITLAQTLGLEVTAEGVETAAQAEQLQALGCDWGQGYFFSRPLPTEAISALLALG